MEGWPRPGDSGVIAVDPEGQSICAAWRRSFTTDDPGFGFVSDTVPELSITVTAGWRGRGVGRALLRAIQQPAERAGVMAISLSVERANPARSLYVVEGYQTIEIGQDSDTMVIEVQQVG